jgi:hypothetical protein
LGELFPLEDPPRELPDLVVIFLGANDAALPSRPQHGEGRSEDEVLLAMMMMRMMMMMMVVVIMILIFILMISGMCGSKRGGVCFEPAGHRQPLPTEGTGPRH